MSTMQKIIGEVSCALIDEKKKSRLAMEKLVDELCLGDNKDRLIPTRVTLDGNVISVAIYVKHTINPRRNTYTKTWSWSKLSINLLHSSSMLMARLMLRV